MRETTIRRAVRGDQGAVEVLWVAFQREQAALDGRYVLSDDAVQRWRNDFAPILEDETSLLIVSERAGRLSGFASAQVWEPLPVYAPSSEVYVNELYVVPTERGASVGSRLLDDVRDWALAQGARRMRMGVLEANVAARRFWERHDAQPFAVTYTINLPADEESEPSSNKGPLGFR